CLRISLSLFAPHREHTHRKTDRNRATEVIHVPEQRAEGQNLALEPMELPQSEHMDPGKGPSACSAQTHFLRDLLRSLAPEENSNCRRGQFFQDGQRKVDYILTYPIKKSSEGFMLRKTAFRRTLRRARGQPEPDRDGAEDETDHHEQQKREKRQQFESSLMEMGLELERDEQTRTPGLGFLKVHAPWSVLCREAEFLKLKMPTRKVYEVKSHGGLKEKLSSTLNRITAPLQLEEKFDASDRDSFFDSKTRSSLVLEILKRTKCTKAPFSMGITSLLGSGVYQAAYPLHDGDVDGENVELNDRKLLYEEWACYSVFYKYQPISLIRKYFGEKIGLYFAWLGVYTQMLIPASVVGVLVFLYGCVTVDDDIPSMEICEGRRNITMCPVCDRVCGYWSLSSACATARASHLFDNPATVLFSVFMALWAAFFMEHWKRRQMRLNYEWDLTGFEDEEVEKEKLTCRDRFPAYMTNVIMILLMVGVTFAFVFGVILYRISTQAALSLSSDPLTRSNVHLTVRTTAAVINLIIILILDELYGALARWLTVMEVPKTEKSFEERLIFKTFILKFFNAFTPIIYIAFFRGRLGGRPGSYLYVFESYRMEECAHGGCLMELCIQLSITMLGKQLIQNNLFEIGIPKLKKLIRFIKSKRSSFQEPKHEQKLQRYETDHFLEPFAGLTPEYMEMMIQFGFVTLFVASFPLAPLFALLNNIIEIRLDAKKFLTELRRPDAARGKDIGIWYNILRGVAKLAVIINAFVISFTSDFIPRLVYQSMFSPDGSMHGFVNHTLSFFNVTHFQNGTGPLQPLNLGYSVSICRYKDYREPPWSLTPYEISKEFWAVLAARLAFVIIFQNLVMLMSDVVDWIIPDIPKDISVRMQREKILMMELFMKEERGKVTHLPEMAHTLEGNHVLLPLHPHQDRETTLQLSPCGGFV
ncbi:hypothetical protein DNTS_015389, partial [Danionella cerebrum]